MKAEGLRRSQAVTYGEKVVIFQKNRNTVTTNCYQEMIHALSNSTISMTLSDLQGHSLIANLFKCYFWYSCTAVNKISTTKPLVSRLQPLSLL